MGCRVTLIVPYLLISVCLGSPQPLTAQASSQQQCNDWQTCRDLSEQARAAGDYETFHDLVWRAVQTRGRRDPELVFLLARAQSLSGRPHDAMITLQRLAQELHVAKDVSTDDDFRRVRALPGWADVEALIKAVAEQVPPEGSAAGFRQKVPAEGSAEGFRREVPPKGSADEFRQKVPTEGSTAEVDPKIAPEPSPNRPAEPSGGTSNRNLSAEPAGGTSSRNPPAEPSVGTSRRNPLAEPPVGTSEEVARFPARAFDAGGLAYDAVSRRFVIGNLPARKLTIVEEGTNRAATLSGDAAQLLNVRALEIDRSQGDLWVISEGSRDGANGTTSELHKLQLVSGRVLTIYKAESSDDASRFVDIAVGKSSEVLVLDAAGPRLLRPSRDGHLVTVMDLPKGEVTSLAPAEDARTVYVAYMDRIARADLATRHVDRLIGKQKTLSGFARLRWHKGSLVGARVEEGKQQIVQLRLSPNGLRVASTRLLDGSDAPATSIAALDLLEDDFFYLVPGEPQASIRRIRLK